LGIALAALYVRVLLKEVLMEEEAQKNFRAENMVAISRFSGYV
jgi:hypothetical protein